MAEYQAGIKVWAVLAKEHQLESSREDLRMNVPQADDTKECNTLPGSLSFIQQAEREKPVEDLRMGMVHTHVFSLRKQ